MPSIDENLAFAPASELRALIGDKQVSPVELTALYYDRIDRLDSQLNAYLTLCRDEAMQAASDAEDAVMRGDALGALHGIPISIKDLEMSKGIRSTSGSLPFKDRIPDEDSIVVERVKAAGAIILGKTKHSRVRAQGHDGESAWRAVPQSVEYGTHAWRFERWRGCRPGSRSIRHIDRQRRGRVHSHTRQLLWAIRYQANSGTCTSLCRTQRTDSR